METQIEFDFNWRKYRSLIGTAHQSKSCEWFWRSFFLSSVNNFKNAEVDINKHSTVQLLIMLSISQTEKTHQMI